MMHLLLILYCSGVFIFTAAETVRELQQSMWEVRQVRRIPDTQVTMKTLEAKTVASCSYACSERTGVQAQSLYFLNGTNTCYCNKDIDSGSDDVSADEIVYGVLKTFYKKEELEEKIERYTVWPFAPDCLTLHATNYRQDGVYRIDPIGGAVTDTWCDMTNGGWTVIQRRLDGSENFNRSWTDYVNGFGNRTGEYWLGLENIHHLTKTNSHLEIWMEAFPGVTPPSMTARYTSFMVSDNATEYTLHVSGFTGDCKDSFRFHDGYRFSTHDNDNDAQCGKRHGGGYWYKNCHMSSPNGRYFQAGEYNDTNSWAKGIHWQTCWFDKSSAKSAVMKVRSP